MFYINKTKNFIKKSANKIKKIYGRALLKDKRFIYKSIKDLPTKVRIDACNFCQLNCTQCPVKREESNIKNNNGFGYLKFNNFKKFIDKNPQIKEIELSNNGEIFLNPELEDIIKYAHEKNIILTAINGVNLNTLTDEIAECLVKYQFREIIISIDAATPETYTIYQQGGNFNNVINNIKKINKYKELYNSEFPKLVYKFIVFGHNEHEIPLAKELAKELNMNRIFFALNWNENYSPIKNIEFVKKETNLDISDSTNSCNKFFIKNYKKDFEKKLQCKLLFDFPQIDWNGDFLGCCSTTYKSFGVNAFEKDFLSVLNSDQVIYAKKMLTDFNTPPRDDIPCTDCHIYKELKEHNCQLKF